MTSLARKVTAAALLLTLAITGHLAPSSAPAQATDPRPGQPPRPDTSASPIEFFRQLLALSPAERETALRHKPAPQRQVLLAKLSQYEKMPAHDREIRLRLLQWRLALLPLLKATAEDRARLLANVPERDRPLAQARLRDWDRLSAAQQAQILGNENSLHFFLYRRHAIAGVDLASMQKIIPPGPSQRLEEATALWRSLPADQRQTIATRLGRLYELPPQTRAKLLAYLPRDEREATVQIIQRFASLSQEQRTQCLDGFARFAHLSTTDRDQFIVNLERWQQLSSLDRQLVRTIVFGTSSPPRPSPSAR